MHTTSRRTVSGHATGAALAALLALAAAGCNVPAEGATGEILFTPDECGRFAGCDFEDSIGVGGAIQVHIQSTRAESLIGFEMLSSDEEVLSVAPVGLDNGLLTFEVVGVGPGVARLVVIDLEGVEVDFLEVAVQAVNALRLDPIIGGDAVQGGPVVDDAFDEIWSVPADQQVLFLVTPLIGEGVPTMGNYDYEVSSTTPELFDFVEDPGELSRGTVQMTLPPGQYDLAFENPFTPPLVVLFEAP